MIKYTQSTGPSEGLNKHLLPQPKGLPLPLHGIINFGLPPIVSIPLFYFLTLKILSYYGITVITVIYLFLALLLSNLMYFEYTCYYHFTPFSSFLGFLSVIYLSITPMYPFSLPFLS